MARGTVAGRVALGARIREVRELAGISLADGAAEAGISYSYLSDVERGSRNLSLVNIEKLAGALGLSLAELFKLV